MNPRRAPFLFSSSTLLFSLLVLVALPSAAQGSGDKRQAPAAKNEKRAPAARENAPPVISADSRLELRIQASQMAAGMAAAEAALTPEELAIAERVHTGVMPCELGALIKLEGDPGMPGYFNMTGKNFRYRMVPVITSTGAVRLEDREAGTVWLQLANKSMLMNQTAGRRMADECMSPAQVSHAHDMAMNPTRGLLDGEASGGPGLEINRSSQPLRAAP